MITNVEKENKIYHPVKGQGIRGKKVVIIGDMTSAGHAMAAYLVDRGAKVFIALPNPRELTAAFAVIAKTGGEWDGMVADMSRPEEVRRFFDQAERRLGQIDAVINHLPSIASQELTVASSQSLCVIEAVQRLQANRRGGLNGGQIINIGAPGSAGVSPALRHQASELGIRMTLITSGDLPQSSSQGTEMAQVEDLARCVCDILSQPLNLDMIFLHAQSQVL